MRNCQSRKRQRRTTFAVADASGSDSLPDEMLSVSRNNSSGSRYGTAFIRYRLPVGIDDATNHKVANLL